MIAVAEAQYYVDNKAATAGESYARGISDMVRSAGQANLANSQAAENWEAARSAYFDNRIQATQTYFEMRAMNRAYRAAERGPRPTSEELYRLAKEAAPPRLGPSELDPVYGRLRWPLALTDPIFDQQRAELDQLFSARAVGQVTARTNAEITTACQAMMGTLKNHIKDFTSTDYMQARSFLTSLMAEPQYAAR